MDKLLDEVATEGVFEKRKKTFKKVLLRSQEKAYWLPYVAPVNVRVWNKRLKNYKPLDYFFSEAALVEAWLEG